MEIKVDFDKMIRMTSFEIAEFIDEDHATVMDHIEGLATVLAINMPVKEEVIYLRDGAVDVIEGYSFKGFGSRKDVAVLMACLDTTLIGVVLANFDDRVENVLEWAEKRRNKLIKKVDMYTDIVAAHPLVDKPVG